VNRIARTLVGLWCTALAVLSGCTLGQVIDFGRNQPDPAAFEPGAYWVLENDAGLDLLQMPAYRGADGKWLSLAGVPEWFTREGLYSHAADGSWNLETPGDQRDLDALLQVWDPPPQGP
jgi:hypothetical protein